MICTAPEPGNVSSRSEFVASFDITPTDCVSNVFLNNDASMCANDKAPDPGPGVDTSRAKVGNEGPRSDPSFEPPIACTTLDHLLSSDDNQSEDTQLLLTFALSGPPDCPLEVEHNGF
ncbi:unnamed protein product [Cuscuta epithymum]|uniref:Uncharacterized protein n=1 Tax=Cuscuta epithymum TaxID=186058 RepID=A0AAV0CSA7_9ASTE|nr:unnamed protein product [Cuscuta epithymum]